MLKGLRAIADLAGVRRRILVYGGTDSWRTDEAIDVMAVPRFAAEVTSGL